MSHFTVAVIHRKDQFVHELLKPYDEKIAVDPYIKFTKAEAIEYGHKYYKPGLTDEQILEILAEVDGADEDGNILSTYNPKSKWDWYETGGRWHNLLTSKNHNRGDEFPIRDILKTPETHTYAVITPDGEWHAPGQMGWFGCSSETDKEWEEWRNNWQKRWIDDQDPELIMTIIDCHI